MRWLVGGVMAVLLAGFARALESVGYAPWWSLDTSGDYFRTAFLDQAAMLDEIVYFGEFRFQSGGSLYFSDGNAAVVPILVSDGSGGWQLNLDANYAWYFDKMTAVVAAIEAAAPDTRIAFTIGGWANSQNFADVGKSAAASANAAQQIRALMDLVGFDGVDFDWEQGDGVSPNVDAAAYANLTASTRLVLNPGERITAAMQVNLQSVGLAIEGDVDTIRVMTYDDPGAGGDPNPTSVIGAETTIASWMAAGIDPGKLGIGVAMYGRPLDDPWSGQAAYAALDAQYLSANGEWLPDDVAAYLGYGFDSPDSILEKGDWAVSEGLGQIFAWDLSQDTRDGGHYLPLTTALSDAAAVPEPAALAMLLLGAAGAFLARRYTCSRSL